jgi:hypothetical protein
MDCSGFVGGPKKISPPRNRREFSLTLKTTNMNNVDSYERNLHSLIKYGYFSYYFFLKSIAIV